MYQRERQRVPANCYMINMELSYYNETTNARHERADSKAQRVISCRQINRKQRKEKFRAMSKQYSQSLHSTT